MTDAQPPYQPADIQTEELGSAPQGRGRLLVIVLVAALVVGVLGGGAWAAYSFLNGGGPRPEEALPASTVAVVSVDLDPSAGQKIAAIKTIRKFPGLKKSLGLEADDDLRKYIFDKATESGDCDGLDFEDDVKPWVGKRAAFAAVDLGEDEPSPAIALQITDQGAAKTGFAKIAKCADAGEDFRWSIGEDYLIASDSQEHADEIRRSGEKKSLADDAGYQRWHDEAGDAGVLNFYVAKRVTKYLDQLLDGLGEEIFGGGSGSAFDEGAYSGEDLSGLSVPSAARAADDPDPLDRVRDELEKFDGLAGTIRFAGGGMELSVAAGGLGKVTSTKAGAPVGEQVSQLPGNTVFAFGFGVSEAFSDAFAEGFADGFGSALGGDPEDATDEFEKQTGLRLPEDLQTLLGDALVLSIGGDAPRDLAEIESFADVPVGLVIHGDADKIKDLIRRVEDRTGYRLSDIPIIVGGDDDTVVLTPSKDYAEELSKAGSLGEEDNFRKAVPNAERALGITYLDFDSNWRETLLRFAEDDGASASDVRDADANTKPLKSLGISSWVDGSTTHLLIKVATD